MSCVVCANWSDVVCDGAAMSANVVSIVRRDVRNARNEYTFR
jgi:hypothetical protein